jgi:hypothetical protein
MFRRHKLIHDVSAVVRRCNTQESITGSNYFPPLKTHFK